MPEQGKTFLEQKLEEIITNITSDNTNSLINFYLISKAAEKIGNKTAERITSCSVQHNILSKEWEVIEVNSSNIIFREKESDIVAQINTIKNYLIEYIKKNFIYVSAKTPLKIRKIENYVVTNRGAVIPSTIFDEIISTLKNEVLDKGFINYYTYLANSVTKFFDQYKNVYDIGVNDTHILGLEYSNDLLSSLEKKHEQIKKHKSIKEYELIFFELDAPSLFSKNKIVKNLLFNEQLRKLFPKYYQILFELNELRYITESVSSEFNFSNYINEKIKKFNDIHKRFTKLMNNRSESEELGLFVYQIKKLFPDLQKSELIIKISDINFLKEILSKSNYYFSDSFKRSILNGDKTIIQKLIGHIKYSPRITDEKYLIIEKIQNFILDYNQKLSYEIFTSDKVNWKDYFTTSNGENKDNKLELFGLAHLYIKEQIHEAEEYIELAKLQRIVEKLKEIHNPEQEYENLLLIINEYTKTFDNHVIYNDDDIRNLISDIRDKNNININLQKLIGKLQSLVPNFYNTISIINLLKNFDKLLYLNNINFTASVKRVFFTNITKNSDNIKYPSHIICETTTLGEIGLTYFRQHNEEGKALFYSVQNSRGLVNITSKDSYLLDDTEHTTIIGFCKNESKLNNILSQTHTEIQQELKNSIRNTNDTLLSQLLKKIKSNSIMIRYATSVNVDLNEVDNPIVKLFTGREVIKKGIDEQAKRNLTILGCVNTIEWLNKVTLMNDDPNLSFYNFIGENKDKTPDQNEYKIFSDIKTLLLKQVYENLELIQQEMYEKDRINQSENFGRTLVYGPVKKDGNGSIKSILKERLSLITGTNKELENIINEEYRLLFESPLSVTLKTSKVHISKDSLINLPFYTIEYINNRILTDESLNQDIKEKFEYILARYLIINSPINDFIQEVYNSIRNDQDILPKTITDGIRKTRNLSKLKEKLTIIKELIGNGISEYQSVYNDNVENHMLSLISSVMNSSAQTLELPVFIDAKLEMEAVDENKIANINNIFESRKREIKNELMSILSSSKNEIIIYDMNKIYQLLSSFPEYCKKLGDSLPEMPIDWEYKTSLYLDELIKMIVTVAIKKAKLVIGFGKDIVETTEQSRNPLFRTEHIMAYRQDHAYKMQSMISCEITNFSNCILTFKKIFGRNSQIDFAEKYNHMLEDFKAAFGNNYLSLEMLMDDQTKEKVNELQVSLSIEQPRDESVIDVDIYPEAYIEKAQYYYPSSFKRDLRKLSDNISSAITHFTEYNTSFKSEENPLNKLNIIIKMANKESNKIKENHSNHIDDEKIISSIKSILETDLIKRIINNIVQRYKGNVEYLKVEKGIGIDDGFLTPTELANIVTERNIIFNDKRNIVLTTTINEYFSFIDLLKKNLDDYGIDYSSLKEYFKNKLKAVEQIADFDLNITIDKEFENSVIKKA